MSTIKLIQATFKDPILLLEARNKKGFHVFLYMILLSFILSLPVTFQSMALLNSLKEDGEKIVQKIPEFSITDNQLTTEAEDNGFIYQTNAMIFTFDPEGKRSVKDVETDATSGVLTLALLKNEAVLVLPTIGTTADVLDSNLISLPYSTPQLNIINKDFLTSLLTTRSQNTMLFMVVLITSIIMIFLSFLFDLVIMTFFANIFTKLRMIRLRFRDVFKILVYCATIPTVFTVLLQLIWPSFTFGSLSLAFTLIIYFNIFPRPKRPKRE